MSNNDSYKRTSSINSSLLFFSNQTVNFNDKLLNISDKRLEESSLITINNTDNNTITHKTTTTTKNQTSTTASVSSIEENKITILQCDRHDTDRQQSLESSPSSTSLSSPLLSSFETIFNQRYRQSLSQHQQSSSESRLTTLSTLAATKLPSKMMLGNGVVPPGLLPPLDHYRLQLYNYAMVERLRCSQYHSTGSIPICPSGYPNTAAAAAAAVNNPYGSRLALSMSLFHNRVFQPEEPKPQHSYIGLIAMAILSSPESKLVLSDIYQHILDNYPYFRTRGPGWRNSIRHNLSLNDCFIKAGRSANGKGHYWAIHPANLEDFKKGDFRRRKAQRKVRKHMGLAVDDEGTDSPSPPALAVTPPPHHSNVVGSPFCPNSWTAAAVVASGVPAAGVMANMYSQSSRKRQFDVASLLAPDEDSSYHSATRYLHNNHIFLKGPAPKRLSYSNPNEIDEYIDVVANDVEDNIRQISNKTNNSSKQQYEDNKQFINNVPPIRSLTTFTVENRSFSREEDREIQSANDEINTESPISNHLDDDNIEPNTAPSSPTTWQGFIQQWPNNFNSFGTNNGPMDPRILGRYYGQYMAAAAAQQMAASRRAIAVGNLLNQVNSEDNNIVVNINNNNPDSQIITSQNDNKNNDSDNCNNQNNFNANGTHNKKDDIMELYRNQHLQHQHHHQQQQQPNQSQHQHENHFQQNQNSNNLLNIQTSDC